MKYPIYTSLSYNSHDFQNKADFGSGDFQYTCPRASCEQSAWPVVIVSVLVSEVELKLSNHAMASTIDNSSYRLNFDLGKKNEINHHSSKEHVKIE
jgi:hypothetical protein